MAAVEPREAIKGINRCGQCGGVALGATQKVDEVCASRAGREVSFATLPG